MLKQAKTLLYEAYALCQQGQPDMASLKIRDAVKLINAFEAKPKQS